MTPHFLAHIVHILESIERIHKYREQEGVLSDDCMAYDAILRRLQTLAESAQHLPDDIKEQHSRINWPQIVGFRNILAHNYLGDIDNAIVTKVIDVYLPELHAAMLEHIPNWDEIKNDTH